ncbi:MAG: hypothetical protein AAF846_12665 [Chloroflexota bacterium]
MATLIKGKIHLPSDTENFAGATVYIYVENAGLMDMPAQVVTQTIQHNVTYEGQALAYSVEGQVSEDDAPFNLRVHISTHNSDDVKKGDFVTKRTYSVLGDQSPETVDVNVELV